MNGTVVGEIPVALYHEFVAATSHEMQGHRLTRRLPISQLTRTAAMSAYRVIALLMESPSEERLWDIIARVNETIRLYVERTRFTEELIATFHGILDMRGRDSSLLSQAWPNRTERIFLSRMRDMHRDFVPLYDKLALAYDKAGKIATDIALSYSHDYLEHAILSFVDLTQQPFGPNHDSIGQELLDEALTVILDCPQSSEAAKAMEASEWHELFGARLKRWQNFVALSSAVVQVASAASAREVAWWQAQGWRANPAEGALLAAGESYSLTSIFPPETADLDQAIVAALEGSNLQGALDWARLEGALLSAKARGRTLSVEVCQPGYARLYLVPGLRGGSIPSFGPTPAVAWSAVDEADELKVRAAVGQLEEHAFFDALRMQAAEGTGVRCPFFSATGCCGRAKSLTAFWQAGRNAGLGAGAWRRPIECDQA
jgi:hypothetical protein